MWRWLLGLLLVAGIATGIVVGALNPEAITLDLALFRWTGSTGTIVVVAFAAGLLLGLVFGVLAGLARGRRRTRPSPARAGGSKSLTDA